jgi:CRP-like cAMP-binding protein
VLLVVAAIAFLPRLSAIDSKIAAPGPELALLRQVPFFSPLPFALVEHLASELQSATYEPGEVIIQEGEPGERFYMIAGGRTRAVKDGKQLREMSTGDSFGEIALLRRIPRTATVTAVSHVEARFLVRAEFLAAVTGNPESVDSAEDVVSTRLKTG